MYMSNSSSKTLTTKLFQRLAAGSRPSGTRTIRSRGTWQQFALQPQQQQNQQPQQQWRSMVVVTKTSPTTDPSVDMMVQEASDNSGDSSANTVNTADSIVNVDERLTITPSCVKQVHTLLKRRDKTPDEMFLRVFVDAGGCSGFTYKFELDDELVEEEDIIFEPQGSNGAKVVVDETSLDLIRGSKIDYVQEMIKSAFEVRENPQSESACGCGSSFAVKNFEANPALD